MRPTKAFALSIPILVATGCGGGGTGSTTSASGDPVTAPQQQLPTSLAEIQKAVTVDFATFRAVDVQVDVRSFAIVGNHIFMKLYPSGLPDQTLALGEVNGQETWRSTVALSSAVDRITFELYSDHQSGITGTVAATDSSITITASSL